MAGETTERVLTACGCGAKIRVPADKLGRKARCPKCRRALVLKRAAPDEPRPAPADPPATQPPSASVPEKIRFACSCGTRLAVPGTLAGLQAKCPKCAKLLTVPAAPAEPDDEQDVDSLVAGLMTGDAVAVEPAPRVSATAHRSERSTDPLGLAAPVETPGRTAETVAGEPRTCPCCQQSLGADAVICTDCGINVKTGRALLTTQDEDLDRIYTYTQGILRWLSWIIGVGLYPIASEAFGLRKPWVVRGIAVVTILISVWFMIVYIYNPAPSDPSLANLMLWSGEKVEFTPELQTEIRDELSAEGWSGAEIDELIADQTAQLEHAGFRSHQLITHAFLHGGLFHLAGNMLFLMVLGARVNALIGNTLTIILYPLLAIAAAAAQMAASAGEMLYPMLGASGAVMGLAGMYLILFPTPKVHMVFWWRWSLIGLFRLHLKSFAVRGFWVVLFYIAFDVLYTALGVETGTAHWAHLGGFLAGAGIALLLLFTRLVNARGGDLASATLGRHAWKLLGKPNRPGLKLW
jgi:membrane associated rhomboid family serine protease